jgi:hypothetical protein
MTNKDGCTCTEYAVAPLICAPLNVERSKFKVGRWTFRGTPRHAPRALFRGENRAETLSLFRNTKVAEIIHPLRVNNMSESSP